MDKTDILIILVSVIIFYIIVRAIVNCLDKQNEGLGKWFRGGYRYGRDWFDFPCYNTPSNTSLLYGYDFENTTYHIHPVPNYSQDFNTAPIVNATCSRCNQDFSCKLAICPSCSQMSWIVLAPRCRNDDQPIWWCVRNDHPA